MSSISPIAGTSFYGYVPAALPVATPTAPAAPANANVSGVPASAASANQFEMQTLGLESSVATALFGAAPSDAASTPTFFSNANMFAMLGTQGSAVTKYLNANSGAASSSAPATPAADDAPITPAPQGFIPTVDVSV